MKWVALFATAVLGSSRGESLSGKYVFDYVSGDQYEVNFSAGTLTWTGLKGVDSGKSETDQCDSDEVSPHIHFVSWKENDGTFVALAVNLESRKVYSRGISGGDKWRTIGTIRNSFGQGTE